MKRKIPLIIIAGPTSIGKSSLALDIATKMDAEIISADSRQIYKYFDIGTAKPSIEEQKLVRHHLIDFCDPHYKYTVSEYKKACESVIESIYWRKKTPILVGGTGLYIKSLINDYQIPEAPPNKELRAELTRDVEMYGKEKVYERAKKIDPVAMEKIHPNDSFRTFRVIEVYEHTGKPLSELRGASVEPNYKLVYHSLDMEREKLYERADLRVEQMFEMGLENEVRFLINQYGADLPLLNTINYQEVRDYLIGKTTFEEAKELMKKHTRNFAKRQLTWFRADKLANITLIDTWEQRETLKNQIIRDYKALID